MSSDAANALFGQDPTPTTDRPTAPAPARGNAVERTLYGNEPLPGDTAMFRPAAALREPLAARRDELLDAGYSTQELQARHRAYVEMAHTTGLSPLFVEKLYHLDTDVTLKALRAPTDDTTVTDPAGWFEEGRRAVRDTYGAERGERYLSLVDQFVAQHPQFRTRLEQTGYRDHPDIVEGLVDHIRQLHG